MAQHVSVVVGGQYGSEAKGHVTAQLVKSAILEAREIEAQEQKDVEIINIRVAGPNAGHTVYDQEGNRFALRQIPVGAVYPGVQLYIAPGSEIDPAVLEDEISTLEHAGHSVRDRLSISREAVIIEQSHKEYEAELVGKIGSTGKGIGAARAAHLMRTAQTAIGYFGGEPGWTWREPHEWYAHDDYVHESLSHVVVEGTQGFGLSLRASGHYPKVTSSDARAVDFLAMAGIDPTRCGVEITNWVVARVYPIRVAGDSGPMKGETTWAELGLPEERTTVTQKVRRVGEWDEELVRRAVQANGGHTARVVITMLDQVIPGLAEIDHATIEKIQNGEIQGDDAPDALRDAVYWMNDYTAPHQIGAPVAAITFGPDKILFTEVAPPEVVDMIQNAMAQAGAEVQDGLAEQIGEISIPFEISTPEGFGLETPEENR